LGHFFQRDFVDHALDALRGFAGAKNGFSTKSSTGRSAVLSFSADVAFGGDEDYCGFGSARAATKFFDELAASMPGHADSRRPAGRAESSTVFEEAGVAHRLRW